MSSRCPSSCSILSLSFFCFFFNDTATTEIYTLSLHDALPISRRLPTAGERDPAAEGKRGPHRRPPPACLSEGAGLHVLRPLHPGMRGADPLSRQSACEAVDSCEL